MREYAEIKVTTGIFHDVLLWGLNVSIYSDTKVRVRVRDFRYIYKTPSSLTKYTYAASLKPC